MHRRSFLKSLGGVAVAAMLGAHQLVPLAKTLDDYRHILTPKKVEVYWQPLNNQGSLGKPIHLGRTV